MATKPASAQCFYLWSYQGQSLVDANFHSLGGTGLLAVTDFRGADLRGAVFTGQDLNCSDFSGAKLGASPNTGRPADLSYTLLTRTKFSGALLAGTDFSYSRISCADFSNTILTSTWFGPAPSIVPGGACRTSFAGATLPAATVALSDWGQVDFTGATLQNLQAITLSGQDLTGAKLGGVDLSQVVFTGSNLTGVDFTAATLANAKLDTTALNGAVLDNANLANADLSCAVLNQRASNDASGCPAAPVSNQTAAASLLGATLTGAKLDGAAMSGVNLAGSTLSSTSLRGTDLSRANLAASPPYDPAIVENADFSNANLQYVSMNGVNFTQSVLAGADFSYSTASDTSFEGSVLPGAIFDGAQLQGVSFASAVLQGASFSGASFSPSAATGASVAFSCAQLGGATFANSTFGGTSQYSVRFDNAVMPAASQCCSDSASNTVYCGTATLTGAAYGAVSFPIPQAPVMCPNGDITTGTSQAGGPTTYSCSAVEWTIPNWTATACEQAAQPMWAKPDCGSSGGSNVVFTDSNLKACILSHLPGPPAEVAIATANTMRAVDCAGRGIVDLTGLENFWSLERLDLSANHLTSFALISNYTTPSNTNNTNATFPQLDMLDLSDNAITGANLIAFPNITYLNLANNQLANVNFSANMQLATLLLYNNNLTNLPPTATQSQQGSFGPSWSLAAQTVLGYVDLSGNSLSSIPGLTSVPGQIPTNLQQMSGLQTLDLSNNQLTTIGSISPGLAQQLQRLSLACNPTFSCATLATAADAPIMGNSYCAVLNSQDGTWILLPNPTCPPGLTPAAKRRAPMQRYRPGSAQRTRAPN